MRAPFWSDDFDLDLLKIIPETEEIIGDLADQVLYTHGSSAKGRLNHPSVWNHPLGFVAFFGLSGPAKPEVYHSFEPVVECTVLEMLRSAWVQSWVPIVEGYQLPQIGAHADFDPIMFHVRGISLLPEHLFQHHLERRRAAIMGAWAMLLQLANQPSTKENVV